MPAFVLAFALFVAVALGLTAPVADAAAPAPSTTAPALSPPDAFEGPSEAIFPPQTITIRFDHKLHVGGQGVACTTCHAKALTSASVADRLVPPPVVCDGCHQSDHANLSKVTAIAATPGADACASCHVGHSATDANAVARMELPRANMVFDHQKHASRNIACAQCHGDVAQVGLATRAQLPTMRGCLKCHGMPDAASRGAATSSCETCHLQALGNLAGVKGGRIRTNFASGDLFPPKWLHDAAHTPDFIDRHKSTAADDSQFCASCHKEEFCTGCHDGRVRPRNLHPNDYIALHATEARMATMRCASCHQEQAFCVGCHQRLGITLSGPAGVRDSGRFHPPKEIWSDAPRRQGHHAVEAARNLNACVSCHVERDCVQCHGAAGIGGGFNPHASQGGFLAGCATQLRRNPRPCYACHMPGDAKLASCR